MKFRPFRLSLVGHLFIATLLLSSNGFAQQTLGIDVSHYQGAVNWGQVKQHGIVFAFAKATGGTYYTDPEFSANWNGMRAEGIIRGAYHFYYPNEDATQQAENFVNVVGKLRKGLDMPPVLDVELTEGMDSSQIQQGVATWLSYVQQKMGCTPIIYVDPSFANEYLGDRFSNYPLWVAEYTNAPAPSLPNAWSIWSFWQYSETGNVAGVSGAVDQDRYNGSVSNLKNFNNKLCQ